MARSTELARRLRRAETMAEERLWSRLRNRQLVGQKFRRQVPKGRFVLDFYCDLLRLGVELDGSQHADQAEKDARRTSILEEDGILVIRFWNNEVIQNIDGVLLKLLDLVRRRCTDIGC